MTAARFVRALGLGCLSLALATAAPAQDAGKAYEPTVGQSGKDVVWVPTSLSLADRMLDMAKVTAEDYVIDLGSGDGKIVIAAARRGARAHGIEYNPDLVELSRRNAERAGVAARATFAKADIFESDFSRATVITMFLLPDLNLRLRPQILALKPGTRIVSNSFDMGDWEADETALVDASAGCENSWCTALLWIVPAQVGGKHRVGQGELVLEQKFQVLTGTLTTEGRTVPVTGKVRGEDVVVNVGSRTLRGRFTGGQLRMASEAPEFEPQVGQAGKDVIWVPTPDDVVDRMLDLAQVQPGDQAIDLGSGDGKIAIAAARRGARAKGIEYNPDMVAYAQRSAQKAGVKVELVQGDIFESDFRNADVVTLYLLPVLNERLRPTLLAMRPGTRVVSHAFRMGDWEPDQHVNVAGRDVYFWRVPARVEGTWKLTVGNNDGPTIRITQQHQRIEGQAAWGERVGPLAEASVEGARVRFIATDPWGTLHRFEGVADHQGPMLGLATPYAGGAPRLFVGTRG